MEHIVLTFWAASHLWAILSSSQPLLLAVFGALLLVSSAATRVGGGEAVTETQQGNRGKHVVRTSSLSRTSGPQKSEILPESVRHLTQNAAAQEQSAAEGMFHHV